MKALLVGVDDESKATVANVLGARRHEQMLAKDGADALEIVRHGRPALIIVTDPLIDMSAMEFCRETRACAAGADTVILVIVTGDAAFPAMLEAGATDIYTTSLGTAALEVRVLIAERLVAQHARLRDRELRFRRLFESGVAGVTISDFDGNFREANDAFLRMLGYTREDMCAGRLTWEVITPSDHLLADATDRAQFGATGFLPLREREYVHKDGRHIAALVGSAALEGTTECISYVADISMRKREEEALRASEAQYRALFEHSPFPKFLYDRQTQQFLAVNETATRHYGYTRAEFLRMKLDDIRAEEEVPEFLAGGPAAAPRTSQRGFRRHKRSDGGVIEVELTEHEFAFGCRPCVLAVALDVTERNRMEGRLRQAQKMEAIGSLAGGVAHDFNNLLSIILSYGEMLSLESAPGTTAHDGLEQIVAAGRRAEDLTRQLLAFSRQQILQPRVLDLNAVVEGAAKMLRRLVGEDVELTLVSGPGLGAVSADPGQVEQVLMNLVVNARDAMPNEGSVTIETANVEIGNGFAATHADVKPGPYIMLAVTDTGSGMDAATRERIFEPFFTTKERGKGTGLGLSTVLGIVQQSGGNVSVRSVPGEGTSIKVYLPQTDAGCQAATEANTETRTRGGSETVLLVEDEEPVRALTRMILERHGYRVLEAQNGGDALLICEQHEEAIHVLLTDVIMPRMSGRKLAERLGTMRPEMTVLYMSGYTDDSIVRNGVLESEVAFLQKPITPEKLTQKLREVIDANDRRASGGGSARPPAALH